MKVKFITSASQMSECPTDPMIEVGIVGRSNAGKSSFVNALTNSKAAKISAQPGKTRLLNFFQIGEHYRLVDMPGYGFAKVSGKEQKAWGTMIESFLLERENLAGLLLIMDIRRKWTDDEQMLVDLCERRSMPIIVILNKSDKVKQGEKIKKKREISALEGIEGAFVASSSNKKGIAEAEEYYFNAWISGK